MQSRQTENVPTRKMWACNLYVLFYSGTSCQRPDDLQAAIQQSIAEHEEQLNVMERLKSNCSAIGVEFRGITPGDGNCFFDAISCQLRRLGLDPVGPNQLRKDVVDYISTHQSFEVSNTS